MYHNDRTDKFFRIVVRLLKDWTCVTREHTGSFPLRISMASIYGGVQPLVMDSLTGMPEAHDTLYAPHPSIQ